MGELNWEAFKFVLRTGKSNEPEKQLLSIENFANMLEWFGPIETNIEQFFEKVGFMSFYKQTKKKKRFSPLDGETAGKKIFFRFYKHWTRSRNFSIFETERNFPVEIL
jgi:hypothetical protein